MEQYLILCLDCHEIFPGGHHTCRAPEVHLTANSDSTYKREERFDGMTSSENSVNGNGTPYQPEVSTNLEETFSDQMRDTIKTTCEISTQQNVDFSSSLGTNYLQQQIGDTRDGSSVFEPEELKPNSSVIPLIQVDWHNHCTSRVSSNFQRMSDDLSMNNNFSSLGNVGATAGPSTEWNVLSDCEPLDAEAYRRPEDKHFVCPFCGKTSGKKRNFLTHVRTHTGEKPYPCDMCEKKFNTRYNLDVHILTHTGQEPYPCDLCEKKFKTRNALKEHRWSHTGEKPYGCIVCGKYFRHASSLRNHYKNIHKCNGNHPLK